MVGILSRVAISFSSPYLRRFQYLAAITSERALQGLPTRALHDHHVLLLYFLRGLGPVPGGQFGASRPTAF